MQSTKIVESIVKIYFVGAVVGSFSHVLESAHKLGLAGWEAWSLPFMIDGLAILGLVIRGEAFSKATRKIGLRVQCVAGAFTLAGNVYAASNAGEVIFGIGIVTLFLTTEWLSHRLESAEADRAREAQAKRSAAARKAAATRKRNARKAKAAA